MTMHRICHAAASSEVDPPIDIFSPLTVRAARGRVILELRGSPLFIPLSTHRALTIAADLINAVGDIEARPLASVFVPWPKGPCTGDEA